MPGTLTLEQRTKPVCDTCQREVDRVRGSMWHGEDRICMECFCQWYDPDNGTFDPCNRFELGNYVRSKHGLPPLVTPAHSKAP